MVVFRMVYSFSFKVCTDFLGDVVYSFDPDGQFWHSSMITQRLKQSVVCTSTGTTYKLVGKIVKSLALAQGSDNYVVLCCWLLVVLDKKAVKCIVVFMLTHTHTTVLRLCGICPGKPG